MLLADKCERQAQALAQLRGQLPPAVEVGTQCGAEMRDAACGHPEFTAMCDRPTHSRAHLLGITGLACSLCPEGIELSGIDSELLAPELLPEVRCSCPLCCKM